VSSDIVHDLVMYVMSRQ